MVVFLCPRGEGRVDSGWIAVKKGPAAFLCVFSRALQVQSLVLHSNPEGCPKSLGQERVQFLVPFQIMSAFWGKKHILPYLWEFLSHNWWLTQNLWYTECGSFSPNAYPYICSTKTPVTHLCSGSPSCGFFLVMYSCRMTMLELAEILSFFFFFLIVQLYHSTGKKTKTQIREVISYKKKISSFTLYYHHAHNSGHQTCECFPMPTNSLTPAWWPAIQVSSNIIYLKIASDPTG